MTGSREDSVQWTTEQAGMLADLINGGVTSFNQAAGCINAKFGTRFTRCAVGGKAKRMGLCQPRKVKLPKPSRKPRTTPDQRPDIAQRKAAAGPKIAAAPVELRCDPIPPGTLHLLDLGPGMCRYPTGEGADMRFCGRWKVEGSYCAAHAALCLRSPEPRIRPSFR